MICLAAICITSHCTAQVRTGGKLAIGKATKGDLYLVGGSVVIDAPIDGDLVIIGGTVVVRDTITQDILVSAGTVSLNGFVGGDVRCAGGTVHITGTVSEDVLVTAGEIHVSRQGIVSGDLLSLAGDVVVDGTVEGEIKNESGTFALNGIAAGDIECRSSKIVMNGIVNGNAVIAADIIEIRAETKFAKDVRFWNKAGSLNFLNSLRGGDAAFDKALEIERGKWYYLGFKSVVMTMWYLSTGIVMILLVHYLFQSSLRKAAKNLTMHALKSLGVGILFLVGVPVVIVVLFTTVVMIPVGVLAFIGFVTIILLASVIVALLVSNWINMMFFESFWKDRAIILSAFGIFVLLKLVSLMPVIGPAIVFLLACVAFGGLLLNVGMKRKKEVMIKS